MCIMMCVGLFVSFILLRFTKMLDKTQKTETVKFQVRHSNPVHCSRLIFIGQHKLSYTMLVLRHAVVRELIHNNRTLETLRCVVHVLNYYAKRKTKNIKKDI